MAAHQLIDMSVAEIMVRWPGTIAVFVAYRLHCVGCPIGPFHTLADAAAEHRIDHAALLRDVTAAVAREVPASGHRQ